VIVNAEPTPFDDQADVVIEGRAGEVLPRLAELVRSRV
jgi:NAD-dependent SIR2 family protein deacetylase